ncbi:glycosyltransferase family 2 protein [Winogradskyella litorisediminis]|uniref:Glycosyltransferase family 2 protein n=1 Tax=Winogradskyella litorisediminis TaxID=1156618 RepID=A0ABW3N7H4_9FLAO
MPKISVIISTYNQPEWLRKVFFGYEFQTFKDFEIIIADDGSTDETKDLIVDFSKTSEINITHIWQDDEGFQKTKILNKAILKTKADYLLFTDGDCIPRQDFVETHYNLKRQNCFLSGGYFKLPELISKAITIEDIKNQNCFNKDWLLSKGLKSSFKLNKLTVSGFKECLLNTFTPTKATWDGMNASGWKADILKVNGFDERMQYGGEDRELGERLMNLGIKPLQIRYSAICVHLFHTRGYKNAAAEKANLFIRKETKSEKRVWTKYGILKA